MSFPQSLAYHTGKGTNLRKINFASCYKAIGPSHAEALLGFIPLLFMTKQEDFLANPKHFGEKNFTKPLQ